MNISIVSRDKSSVELEIHEEDQSIIAIIHHELIGSKRVEFAAFKSPHPLLPKILLKIDTKGSAPLTELSSSYEKASIEIKKISDEATKVFKRGGG